MILSIYEWSIIYITLYAFITSFFLNKQRSKKVFIFLATGHLLVIQGLRSIHVGVDLGRYLRHYNSTVHNNLSDLFSNIFDFEIGYNILTSIISNLGLSFNVFLFIISLFNLLTLAWFIHRYSIDAYLSYLFYIVLGLYDFGFSGLRQAIALSIILISYRFIEEKKLLNFIVTVLIASSFHVTALAFLVTYFLINTRVTKKYYNLFLIVIVIIFLFGEQLSKVLVSLFNTNYIGYGVSLDNFGTTTMIIASILFFGYLFKRITQSDIFLNDKVYTILFIALIFQMFSSFSYLFTRLNFFFYQFIIVYIPLLYKKYLSILLKNNKVGRFLLSYVIHILLFIIIMLYFHNYLEHNPHGIMPHSFFWEF